MQEERRAVRQIRGIIVSADQNRNPLAHRSSSGQLTNVLQIPPASSHRLTHLLTRRCTRAGAPAQAKSMAELERSLHYPIPELARINIDHGAYAHMPPAGFIFDPAIDEPVCGVVDGIQEHLAACERAISLGL